MQQVTAAAGCDSQDQQPIAPGADVRQGTNAVSGGSRSSSSIRSLLHQQLMSAVEAGDSSRVQQLLDSAKADMIEGQLTLALWYAADLGHSDMVQMLLKAGAAVGARAGLCRHLHRAASNGHLLVVRELLAAGADCDAGPGDYWFNPLYAASKHGHLSVVKALLAAGANVNAAGRCFPSTALLCAAHCGHAGVVQELLAAGADPAVIDREGSTALAHAVRRGHAEVVQALVSGGAVHSKQQWIHAAQKALQYGHTGVVDALLAAPAEVQERSCLLVQACMYPRIRMVEHLLSIGLNSSSPSPEGRSALEAAICCGNDAAVVLLLRASKQQAPSHAQVLDAAASAVMSRDYHVLAQLLLHLHKPGSNRVYKTVSALGNPPAARMALLQGWAADAARQQQQQQALVAFEQDMAGSRPVVMGLLFAVQHPAVRVAAAQEAALP